MYKKCLSLLTCTILVLTTTGCSGKKSKQASSSFENSNKQVQSNFESVNSTYGPLSSATDSSFDQEQIISLRVQGADIETELMTKMIDEFCTYYADQATFDIQFEGISEENMRNTVLLNLDTAADVFTFPDDQLISFIISGALEPLTNIDFLESSFTEESINACSYNNITYAYPLTSGNGYFLYYNSNYYNKSDVKTMDQILKIAEKSGKRVAIQLDAGWYLYSFFGVEGLRLELLPNGIKNECNWNSTKTEIKGVDIGLAIADIIKSPAFLNCEEPQMLEEIKNGDVIACINGIWNSSVIEKGWGDGFAATKLPTYTCANQQIQMQSFNGYRCLGVNKYSKQREWATKLAAWLVSEENQRTRYEIHGQVPCNKSVATSVDADKFPAIHAFYEQAPFGVLQRVGNNYWQAANTFVNTLLSKDYKESELQYYLDVMVNEIIS